jgi:Amt family ammonium transporter
MRRLEAWGRIVVIVLLLGLGGLTAAQAQQSTDQPQQPAAAAEAAPAAAAPVAVTPAPKLDSGDTAWMLTSTALVLMMTIPGLALFYGGMVRKKNVLATLMQCFAVCCGVSVLWMVVGYSLAFTPGTGASGA